MDQVAPIGIFDSGFGGLDIMRGVLEELPEYDYIYLGDTARVPYGNRSQEVVYAFTRQAVEFLFEQGCEVVILACNTASSEALKKLQEEYLPARYPERKILGVILPTVEQASEETRNGKIGVIATRATVFSGAFSREIEKVRPGTRVIEKACPLLVPIVEAGEDESPLADMAIQKYLEPLLVEGIDTLILGCTHYGLLRNKIQKQVTDSVVVLAESDIVPNKLRAYLEKHVETKARLTRGRSRRFFSTDVTDTFQELGEKFLGEKMCVEKAILE